MHIEHEYWLCPDCMIVAVNGDTSGLETEERERDVLDGLDVLGRYLVPNFDTETDDGYEEFSWRGCDSCSENANKGGSFYRFATLTG
jgi:hypothetical protein